MPSGYRHEVGKMYSVTLVTCQDKDCQAGDSVSKIVSENKKGYHLRKTITSKKGGTP